MKLTAAPTSHHHRPRRFTEGCARLTGGMAGQLSWYTSLQGGFQSSGDPKMVHELLLRSSQGRAPQSGDVTSYPPSPHHHGSEYGHFHCPSPLSSVIRPVCAAPQWPRSHPPQPAHRLRTEPLSVRPPPGTAPSDPAIPAERPEPHEGRGGVKESRLPWGSGLRVSIGAQSRVGGWGKERGKGGESRVKDRRWPKRWDAEPGGPQDQPP